MYLRHSGFCGGKKIISATADAQSNAFVVLNFEEIFSIIGFLVCLLSRLRCILPF